MLQLSNKTTGDQLTATEWDNHAREKENFVTHSGQTLDSTDTQMLKSAYYIKYAPVGAVTNSGSAYTQGGGAYDPSTLTDGMQINPKINTTNSTSAPTLDYNGTGAKEIVNPDGSTIPANTLIAGVSYPMRYDSGLGKWVLLDTAEQTFDNTSMSWASTNHSEISPYIDLIDTDLGGTPNYQDFKIYVFRIGNIVNINGRLIVDGLSYSSESDDKIVNKINIMDVIKDKGWFDANINSRTYFSASFTCSASASARRETVAYTGLMIEGTHATNPNQLWSIWDRMPFYGKGYNETYSELKLYFNVSFTVTDN